MCHKLDSIKYPAHVNDRSNEGYQIQSGGLPSCRTGRECFPWSTHLEKTFLYLFLQSSRPLIIMFRCLMSSCWNKKVAPFQIGKLFFETYQTLSLIHYALVVSRVGTEPRGPGPLHSFVMRACQSKIIWCQYTQKKE